MVIKAKEELIKLLHQQIQALGGRSHGLVPWVGAVSLYDYSVSYNAFPAEENRVEIYFLRPGENVRNRIEPDMWLRWIGDDQWLSEVPNGGKISYTTSQIVRVCLSRIHLLYRADRVRAAQPTAADVDFWIKQIWGDSYNPSRF